MVELYSNRLRLACYYRTSLRLGLHTSIAKSLENAAITAGELGANTFQIFSASPRMWPHVGARIPEIEAAEFRAKRAELGLGPLVIHANYLINLASSDPVLRVRSIQAYHNITDILPKLRCP